jgi:hypothetical protein
MSDQKALQGLNCPNCGGVIPIPEGQVIVICPYCDLRSMVRGERGILRYQVPQRIDRGQASGALKKFLSGHWAIAMDARSKAELNEIFLAYVPFYGIWGRVAGWAFGQKKVGSGDKARYEPREVRIVEEMTWNGAACDVGEFGVQEVLLADQPLEPFDPDDLHARGLVFEPVGSLAEATTTAETSFKDRVKKKARLDRVSQIFVRFLRRQLGLIYYPLWVLRYLYRGRAFQVVVDGYSGKVVYGKAPGNTVYRAAALVAGMAAGAFVSIDLAALLFWFSDGDSEGLAGAALACLVGGFVIMGAAYRAFRYGEQYEYKPGGRSKPVESISLTDITRKVQDLEHWVKQ